MKTRFRFAALAAVLALVVGSAYAAATVSSTINVQIQSTLANTVGLSTATAPISKALTLSLASGTGASQADRIYTESAKSVAASGTYALDLAGSLTDALGGAFTPAKVKCVGVFASSSNTNNVLVGGDTNNVPIFADKTDKAVVKPGGVFLQCGPGTGDTVTAGTGDILLFTNSSGGTAVVFDIIVIGTSS